MDGKGKEKDKKQVLLRLSPSLWEELVAWSEDEFRSLNGQIEFLLTDCVKRRKKSRPQPGQESSLDESAAPTESNL
ncbi:MAG: hypothetical protein H6Q60_705 [Oscillospiraceae bacterium]|nr:hypothetical protein [Oscillospiraceae bacterium]